jgi:flagellar operon protein
MSAGSSVKINNYQRPIDLIEIANRGARAAAQDKVEGESFKDMFSRELADQRNVTFSKHAQERLYSRGIELSEDHLHRIVDAIDKAASKGSKDALILSDDAAFVVSVKERTVVTVFDPQRLREGIVTAIDSAVII